MATTAAGELTYWEWRDGKDTEVRIPRHPFSAEHNLYSFEWDDLGSARCPYCFETFTAGDTNLGDVLDWALGHNCE